MGRQRPQQAVHGLVVPDHAAIRILGEGQADGAAVEEGFEFLGLGLQRTVDGCVLRLGAQERVAQQGHLVHRYAAGQAGGPAGGQLLQRAGDAPRDQRGQQQADQKAGAARGKRRDDGLAVGGLDRPGRKRDANAPARHGHGLPCRIDDASIDIAGAVHAGGTVLHGFGRVAGQGGARRRGAPQRIADEALLGVIDAGMAPLGRAGRGGQPLPHCLAHASTEHIAHGSALHHGQRYRNCTAAGRLPVGQAGHRGLTRAHDLLMDFAKVLARFPGHAFGARCPAPGCRPGRTGTRCPSRGGDGRAAAGPAPETAVLEELGL